MSDEKFDPATQMTYVEIGGQKYYVDNSGGLHSKPSEVISENQRTESDWSKSRSGACDQDVNKVPNPPTNDSGGKKNDSGGSSSSGGKKN